MVFDFCRCPLIISVTGYDLFTAAADNGENPLQWRILMQPLNPLPPAIVQRSPAERRAVLMDKAKELEAAFLSQMLSYAGMSPSEGPFSGGEGEQQYTSFLRDAQAKAIVDHGGIGLAENLFKSLVKHDTDQS